MINRDFWNYFDDRKIQEATVRGVLRESAQVVDYERKMLKSGRYWQITKDEVRAIYSIVRIRKPRVVIETGMGSGVSTTTILSALGVNGRLISIDPGLPYGKGDREVGFIIPSELRVNLEHVKGTSSEMISGVLDRLSKLDLFFHDSDHSYENVTFELNSVWAKLGSDPHILVDNYDWTEAAQDFAKKKKLRLWNLADDLALLSR